MAKEVLNLKSFVEGIISLVDDVFQSFSLISDSFLVSLDHGALPFSSSNIYTQFYPIILRWKLLKFIFFLTIIFYKP